MANPRTIEILVTTQKGNYRHEIVCDREDFNILSTPISQLTGAIVKHQNENIVKIEMKVVSVNTTPLYFNNIACNLKIKSNNPNIEDYEETYMFGPSGDKNFDLIGTPSSLLKKDLDCFDYDDIEEINVSIKRGENIWKKN